MARRRKVAIDPPEVTALKTRAAALGPYEIRFHKGDGTVRNPTGWCLTENRPDGSGMFHVFHKPLPDVENWINEYEGLTSHLIGLPRKYRLTVGYLWGQRHNRCWKIEVYSTERGRWLGLSEKLDHLDAEEVRQWAAAEHAKAKQVVEPIEVEPEPLVEIVVQKGIETFDTLLKSPDRSVSDVVVGDFTAFTFEGERRYIAFAPGGVRRLKANKLKPNGASDAYLANVTTWARRVPSDAMMGPVTTHPTTSRQAADCEDRRYLDSCFGWLEMVEGGKRLTLWLGSAEPIVVTDLGGRGMAGHVTGDRVQELEAQVASQCTTIFELQAEVERLCELLRVRVGA